MPLRNDLVERRETRDYLAYLGALTLLFSYAEMFLPRTVPFFRLGLGNAVILLAFGLDFPSFLLLCVIKAFASSLMAGTLFSPFFILSLAQSICSGIVMYGAYHTMRKLFSLYGISILGAAVSAFVQIALASLYLGEGTYALLGPMMLFSLFAGLLTAFMAIHLHIPEKAPLLIENNGTAENFAKKATGKHFAFPLWLIVSVILIAAIFTLMQSDLLILGICLAASLVAQKISGRRIMLLPHLSMWIFVMIANLLSPSGKVLINFCGLNITEGALLMGLIQSLKLSAVSALSQCAASLKPKGKSLIALSLKYFRGLSNTLRKADGNIIKKIRTALAATEISE